MVPTNLTAGRGKRRQLVPWPVRIALGFVRGMPRLTVCCRHVVRCLFAVENLPQRGTAQRVQRAHQAIALAMHDDDHVAVADTVRFHDHRVVLADAPAMAGDRPHDALIARLRCLVLLRLR